MPTEEELQRAAEQYRPKASIEPGCAAALVAVMLIAVPLSWFVYVEIIRAIAR